MILGAAFASLRSKIVRSGENPSPLILRSLTKKTQCEHGLSFTERTKRHKSVNVFYTQIPPSDIKTWPVTKLDASEAR